MADPMETVAGATRERAPAAAPSCSPPDATGCPTAPGIQLEWSVLRRGRRQVLTPGRVRVPEGRAIGLIGANGAGKSTLLMALAGLLRRCAGRATASLHGHPMGAVGYLPQRPSLPPWLGVARGLELVGGGADTPLSAVAGLDVLRPLLGRRAGQLSGGQLQAIGILAVLGSGHPLVLLDEPFNGVGLELRAPLSAAIGEYRRRHPSSLLIFTSHQAADIHELCDWVVALREGRVVRSCPREALSRTSDPALLARQLASLIR